MTTRARCLVNRGAGCGWAVEGDDPGPVELAARVHSGEGRLKRPADAPVPPHPTLVENLAPVVRGR